MKEILLALTLGFSITFLLGLALFPMLKKLKMGQTVLSYVKEHKGKSGTPTMGGIMFIFGIPIAYFIIMGFSHIYANITIAVFFAYGLLGFLDDFIKIKYTRNLGLRAYQKIIGQLAIAAIVSVFMFTSKSTDFKIPFSEYVLNFGAWSVPLIIVTLIACSNSVNITDGLDGLSGGVSVVYLLTFLCLIYMGAMSLIENGMTIGVEHRGLAVLASAAIGGVLAFLTFNAFPAKLFMGDTGSLALGGFAACVGIFSGLTLFIPIIGIMFLFSTLSVIIQVFSFKTTGRRVFKMAPFHHHLQQIGMSETRVTVTYMVITLLIGAVTVAFSI